MIQNSYLNNNEISYDERYGTLMTFILVSKQNKDLQVIDDFLENFESKDILICLCTLRMTSSMKYNLSNWFKLRDKVKNYLISLDQNYQKLMRGLLDE